MKKRLFALLLCLVLLASVSAPVVSAESAATEADGLFYTVSYGTTDGKTVSDATALNAEQAAAYTDGRGFTLNSSTGLPYQLFEIDTAGVTGDSLVLTVGASTIEHERVALRVYNVTSASWDSFATVVSAGDLKATVPLADYSADGKMKAMVTLDYVANGSNRFLWSTDQQHYTKHDDLNETYYKIHEYMVQEYQNDNVAYVINTGDIVDDTPNLPNSAKQWKLADAAFSLLDEAGVPYGIVTGNHDVGDYPINNYINYNLYFTADRYENNPWYGGTPDNNKCHYDLVTVGNYDFLILYFGYGMGSETAVLEWANEVLAMYPHRNAILCTHQYLKPSNLEQSGRADIIHNAVVTQNPNVKMVLSGHYDGAGYKWRDADGHQVLEVVSDYQFVQALPIEHYEELGHEDPWHRIGGTSYCNGEGYMREILINSNTIDMYAFSPVTGGVTPFGARDDLRFTVELQANERTLTTFDFTASATDGATISQNSDESIYLVCDAPAVNALIEQAATIDKTLYTKESYKAMNTALKAAKKAVKNSEALQAEYVALSTALGALEEKTFKMDPAKLETVHKLDLSQEMWQNGEGVKGLDKPNSFIHFEATENGGFTAKKTAFSKNDFPSMKYTQPIIFTPKDGKVYLYLDVDAGSTWSIYPKVIQDMQQYEGRFNYAIEGSFKRDLDAGSGTYKGVYDITQALVNIGVDPTKEMTITFAMHVVPGPVTVNEITVLTGEYPESFSFEDYWQWFLLGGVVLLGAAAIIFALLYKPKANVGAKTAQAVPLDETAQTPSDNTDADEATKEETE